MTQTRDSTFPSRLTHTPYAWLVAAALAWTAAEPVRPQSLLLDFSPSPEERFDAASHARKRKLRVPRCKTPPVIDGALDDDAWRRAARVPRLFSQPPQTSFRVCFDDGAIYVGATCQELPGHRNQSKPWPRDGDAWKDDCLEIFILPSPQDPVVCQFVINGVVLLSEGQDPRSRFVRQGKKAFIYEICMGYQAEPIIVDDEVYLFYEACNYDHGSEDWHRPHSRITAGLATLPRDRFVSLQTGLPQPCRVVTKPFVVDYPKLSLNAATWGDGDIRVEALTRDWKPIDGFTAQDSDRIQGNAFAHPVRWKDNADFGRLVGKEVRLEFYMVHSRVHAMTLDTEDRPAGQLPDLTTSGGAHAEGPVGA